MRKIFISKVIYIYIHIHTHLDRLIYVHTHAYTHIQSHIHSDLHKPGCSLISTQYWNLKLALSTKL